MNGEFGKTKNGQAVSFAGPVLAGGSSGSFLIHFCSGWSLEPLFTLCFEKKLNSKKTDD